MPLLPVQTGTMMKEWFPAGPSGPWHFSFGNSFALEDWKPLPAILEEGERDYVPVKVNGLFVSPKLNVLSLPMQMVSREVIGEREES